ncbi:MAG: hypothetical protein IJY96_05285 [Oscillospiraceae bacterium]|nr:hypothetical protein [Oscillospiraceae bacterium]
MTLGEGKRKVYMLMDEYSSGGSVTEDADIEMKMADFFDIGQKQVAEIKRIRRTHVIERVEGETLYPMPDDFLKLICIWRGDSVTKRFRWRGGKLEIPLDEKHPIELEYFAMPATIGPDTPDEYVFEVSEDAAKALPYFVASQQLVADLVMDYGALWNLYQSMLSTLDMSERGGTVLRNSFYRR